ncbi:single-stranded-DNA-specific exonuclease RecJ, partial [Patescibacteria group bacterium]|nr:single-stranded-DNA-specific exonuclease RecJ [Patescibacteria group bacterium]
RMNPTTPTPDQLQAILLERLGLSPTEQQEFLFPTYALGDVSKFDDMAIAVERIKKAVDEKEQIGIYADYDCDGIPGAVVLVDFFKVFGVAENVHVYIPDRHDEGYGVSTLGIGELEKKGVTLMITVDVGITALAEVADAQSRGIDVIVTDHHAPLSMYPAAHAVVHPAKGSYNKDLCGAAVAFTLVRAYLEKYSKEHGIVAGWEKWLLDMVGFATLSDMVPLVGENRVLAAYGLMVMKKTRRVGLRTLFANNGLMMNNLIETDLTFTVAPRLNAASRMRTPMLAFNLLATEDKAEAMTIVAELDKINNERKLLVARITKEAHSRLAAREMPEIVVIGDPEWRPAVLGLVANKLQETYNRSFFVWGEAGDGTLKGSCRMIAVHHAAYIFQALPETAMIHGGGHQAAGGFAVTKEQVHFLEEALNTAHKTLGDTIGVKEKIDSLEMPLAIVTTRHLQAIRRLAPFGVGNSEPEFLFKEVTIVSTKKFGKTKEHLECVVSDSFGTVTAFTFFASDELCAQCVAGATISFTATMQSGFRGGVRLRIVEML